MAPSWTCNTDPNGALVIFRNATLEKTSDGAGRVTAHTLEELRALDAGSWFDPGLAGTRIPTLDEALDLLKGKLLINIELKVLDTLSSGLGPDTVKAVHKRGMADQVVISSFNPFALRRAKQAGPEIECALLLAGDLPGWMHSGVTRHYGRADGLHPDFVMVDETYVARARKHGLPVRVWTVDDEADMRRLIASHGRGRHHYERTGQTGSDFLMPSSGRNSPDAGVAAVSGTLTASQIPLQCSRIRKWRRCYMYQSQNTQIPVEKRIQLSPERARRLSYLARTAASVKTKWSRRPWTFFSA